MKKFISILFISIFLLGCYGPKKMTKSFDPWIGKDINEMVNDWGPPTKIFDMPNGSQKIYTWSYISYSIWDGSRNDCVFDWTVDNNGLIKSYRYKGNCGIRKNKGGNQY